jgi:NAD dependent epimerase/dehydratase family enzyme
VLHRPSWLPAPRPALRAVLGEQADLLLHGQRALPARLTELGFRFAQPNLRGALEDALR